MSHKRQLGGLSAVVAGVVFLLGCSASAPPAVPHALYGTSDQRQYIEYGLSYESWVFQEWIASLGEMLFDRWEAPYGYRLGILSGSTVVEMSIDADGGVSRIQVLERDGHESLHSATLACLNGLDNTIPLPSDCGVNSLSVTLKFCYPARQS